MAVCLYSFDVGVSDPVVPLSQRKLKAPKVPIQPCRLRSDSAPPGTIEAQLKPKQPHQKAIPAHAGAHFGP